MSIALEDATEALPEALAACAGPHLIGVRHHSPVLAAAMPALLEAADPDAVLIELPLEAGPWLEWLGHPDTVAPVALVLGDPEHGGHGYYPFADFSPELAAARWARANGVPVHAIDLPAAVAATAPDPADHGRGAPGLNGALLRATGTADTEELWDRLVEARSYGAEPERVRRAALALGWAHRADALERGRVGARDRAREAWMRRRVEEIGAARPAAVVGSFHAAALLPGRDRAELVRHLRGEAPEALPATADVAVPEAGARPGRGITTALIPYTFELLDSRSGYPAGIRDPEWQQDVYEAGGDPDGVERAAVRRLSAIGGHLRADGHVCGVPDVTAAYRMARDLAALRGLPAPGRRELVEGLTSALAQGEPLGRARAIAGAAHTELVGSRRGAPAPGAPASGLATHVAALLADLGLPGPDSAGGGKEIRLDPLRARRDRERHVALNRLCAAGVAYAEQRAGENASGGETLGRFWTVRWSPGSAATLELASCYGTTLEQVARGRIGARLREAGRTGDGGGLTPAAAGALLTDAAECALADLATELGERVEAEVLPRAGLADAIALHDRVQRVVAGQVPGMSSPPESLSRLRTRLAETAIASVPGMSGSTDPADATALLQVVRLVQAQAALKGAVGAERLLWHLDALSREGGPLAQGAAASALLLLGELDSDAMAARLVGWLDLASPPAGDGAPSGGGGTALALRLAGALAVAAPVIESDPGVLDALSERVEGWTDAVFLNRLPALRDGFETLSAAARARFLASVTERLGEAGGDLAVDPALAVALARADAGARAAVDALLPGLLDHGAPDEPVPGPEPARPGPRGADSAIGAADRWRLILGRPPEDDGGGGLAGRAAAALDELYGRGHGEGSQASGGRRGGTGRPEPATREWADELQALFGTRVREEVLGRAAGRGRSDVLDHLDPAEVTASVDLLERVLSLAGALPEARLARLRPLVDRIIRQLVAQLARRLRPALSGLSVPRPTRRPGGRLDLGRTVRANLRTVRPGADGPLLIPEQPVFTTRARRSADWHVHVVVDVSGSMERSTIYAALVAAVLHGLPALSVSFTTFSTKVVDLTDRVADPLSLLLEVSVGGGTDIGAGLAHTRAKVRVPGRTIVALITDFEEGGRLGRTLAEVRALAGSGAHLLGLAALDDAGKPVYNKAIAGQFVAAGMPVAALSPEELAAWIGEKVRG
ncbi:DUF5682 family protein [Actinorugispora endophytica]|uniref:VWA domain containing CoxE-like protein n=1 Tax=Actinorugispora endophytica TaxID=1605990 RepID=A0A4V3D7G2_9ACTN|nr:DUF5682 family protein [Actinorugispora endophytica]TDQ47597.1 VWA domain containing CoxE-like protein [Actinorugispora endophytica]